MKILLAIPGHLKTVPMGGFCLDALRALGHEVSVIDFRSQWHDKICERLVGEGTEEKLTVNRRIRRMVHAIRPDVFVTLFGFDISVETLCFLRKLGIPSACWWINDPFQFERSARKGGHYDFLFTNSAVSVECYKKQGISQSYFLPTACQPDIHRPISRNLSYASQVCFAGDWSPLREQLMLKLHGSCDLRIFGPWRKKIAAISPLHRNLSDGFFTSMQMTEMFCSADIVLNLHTWYGKYDHGVNPRLFEASACGAIQLCDFKQEIPMLFKEGKEILLYKEMDSVRDIINGILQMSPHERSVIGQSAYKRAHGQHTYSHRMAEMLEVMGCAGA